jgi:hypothetical protein
MSKRRGVVARGLAAAMLAFLALLPARAAERPSIRIGWVAVPAELQPLLFAKPGVSVHVHQSYELDAIRFAGTPAMITRSPRASSTSRPWPIPPSARRSRKRA